MKTILKKRNFFWNILIVSIITCLLIVPGYTLAGTPNISLDDAPPMPAYIESQEDLVDVPVIQSQSLSHPMSPTTTNVNIVDLLQQLNETLLLGYLENLTSYGPRVTGTEGLEPPGQKAVIKQPITFMRPFKRWDYQFGTIIIPMIEYQGATLRQRYMDQIQQISLSFVAITIPYTRDRVQMMTALVSQRF